MLVRPSKSVRVADEIGIGSRDCFGGLISRLERDRLRFSGTNVLATPGRRDRSVGVDQTARQRKSRVCWPHDFTRCTANADGRSAEEQS